MAEEQKKPIDYDKTDLNTTMATQLKSDASLFKMIRADKEKERLKDAPTVKLKMPEAFKFSELQAMPEYKGYKILLRALDEADLVKVFPNGYDEYQKARQIFDDLAKSNGITYKNPKQAFRKYLLNYNDMFLRTFMENKKMLEIAYTKYAERIEKKQKRITENKDKIVAKKQALLLSKLAKKKYKGCLYNQLPPDAFRKCNAEYDKEGTNYEDYSNIQIPTKVVEQREGEYYKDKGKQRAASVLEQLDPTKLSPVPARRLQQIKDLSGIDPATNRMYKEEQATVAEVNKANMSINRLLGIGLSAEEIESLIQTGMEKKQKELDDAAEKEKAELVKAEPMNVDNYIQPAGESVEKRLSAVKPARRMMRKKGKE